VEDTLIVFRFVHYAATMFVFGALTFRRMLSWPPAIAAVEAVDPWLRRWLRVASVVALVSAIGSLASEAAQMADEPAAGFDPATLKLVLFATQFGRVWIVRLVICVLLLALLFRARSEARMVSLALALCLLGSLAMIGHAAMHAGFDGALHRVNQALHLLAGGVWFKGLLILGPLLFQSRTSNHRSITLAVVRRFSSLGYVGVGAVLITGFVNIQFVLRSPADLMRTTYGRMWELKIAMVVAMIMLALLHRVIILPRSVRAGRLQSSFALSVLGELGLAAAVVAAASVIGILPPGI